MGHNLDLSLLGSKQFSCCFTGTWTGSAARLTIVLDPLPRAPRLLETCQARLTHALQARPQLGQACLQLLAGEPQARLSSHRKLQRQRTTGSSELAEVLRRVRWPGARLRVQGVRWDVPLRLWQLLQLLHARLVALHLERLELEVDRLERRRQQGLRCAAIRVLCMTLGLSTRDPVQRGCRLCTREQAAEPLPLHSLGDCTAHRPSRPCPPPLRSLRCVHFGAADAP